MKLDKFSYHETIDRSYMIACIVETHLQDHPVLKKHNKINKKVIKAVRLLGEAYQDLCNKSDKKFN